MATVDDRIVQMSFDNASFERKIAATIASLEALTKSLDMANGKKGLDDIGKAAKNFNMGNMASAVEGVSAKFLALSTIGITVLSNLTSRAFDAGVSLVKSLSLDQVLSGYREYETNINSIQTILANTKSKGTGLEEVNAALDELNRYADQTIYNFSEMTRNIGTFTAAGVDLDVSVQSIKGIANLAAISGSNSQQASTAMYQLSQAISTGKVRLQDWNSVVNAGMGGEVFQKALFETGKAMGTIANVPMDQTFKQWTDAGNTFRGSLEQDWLTAEVLTTTLQGFTGEMTEAQLTAIGYTKEAAAEILEMGQIGVDAATKVKTLTQLIDTVKEAIGSGWSTTFRTVIGDFEEAKELFTGISEAIGVYVSATSDARNTKLAIWKQFGGRDALIEGVKNAFQALFAVLAPIKEAFRDIFPEKTAGDLLRITRAFVKFTERLKPTEDGINNIRDIFRGFFAAIKIGMEIVRGVAWLFRDLFDALTGGQEGKVIDFFVEMGVKLNALKEALVDGGGIMAFFERLSEVIQNPLPFISELKDKIVDFFKSFDLKSLDVDTPDILAGAFDRLSQRFESLKKLATSGDEFVDGLKSAFGGLFDILDPITQAFKDWFKNLGKEMAAAAGPGDFDAVLDVVNIGLLGGIAALLAKLVSGGLDLNIGNGFFSNISKSLEEVTGVLKAMQADLKANAILKIAGALGILALSMVVLASVDSAALNRALTAMSIGFGQLITAFAVITKLAIGPKSAASFGLLATGLILLAGAMLLLSVAVKSMSSMNWEELAKGLTGVAGLLTAVSIAVIPLSANSGGMIRAGIGLIAVGVALNLLALAVKQFASMSWEEMAQGLAGVSAGLLAMGAALNIFPDNMVAKGVGILAIGVALNLLATSMKIFATMSWEEMGKGLAGVGGGLLAIAAGMNLMPATLPITAAGLVLVGGALLLISGAMKAIATMSWEELGRGLAGMAGALLILAIAVNAMNGATLGALAMITVASAIRTLGSAMEQIGKLSLKEIGKALLGIAGVLLTIGLSAMALSGAIPAMLGLGLALLALGAGFALFGIGAAATAKAFQILAEAGKAGIGVLMELIDQIIRRIPALLSAFALGIVELGMTLLRAAPVLIEQFGVVIKQILITARDLIPEFAKTLSLMITTGLALIREKAPDFIKTGYELLIALLKGLKDNMGEISKLGIEILLEFIKSLTSKMGDIVKAGLELIVAFVDGILDNIDTVVEAVGRIVTTFITAMGDLAVDIIQAGFDALINFLEGITDNLAEVVSTVTKLVAKFVVEVARNYSKLIKAGLDALLEFLKGISNNLFRIIKVVTDIVVKFAETIGDSGWRLIRAGGDAIIKLIEGFGSKSSEIITAGVETAIAFIAGLGANAIRLANAAADIIITFINALADTIDQKAPEIRRASARLGVAIADGISFGLASKTASVVSDAKSLAGKALDAIKIVGNISSPSKVTHFFGEMMALGLAKGIRSGATNAVNSASDMATDVTQSISGALKGAVAAIHEMDEFQPRITPILDLSGLKKDANGIKALLPDTSLTPLFSYSQAADIAKTEVVQDDSRPRGDDSDGGDVTFTQNIYAPKQLSTADIYRQTRNQITIAKEELSIP